MNFLIILVFILVIGYKTMIIYSQGDLDTNFIWLAIVLVLLLADVNKIITLVALVLFVVNYKPHQ
ncbi:hypothetical protein [Alkalibacillus aidingensis]|uniref:hypothetical protein n=1 Tax=Alkalibacillus aidingensis TaxID=2747607 RepID=UPI0016607C7C|nr:hypothetical protein [Alkalibacillus aidingensis]